MCDSMGYFATPSANLWNYSVVHCELRRLMNQLSTYEIKYDRYLLVRNFETLRQLFVLFSFERSFLTVFRPVSWLIPHIKSVFTNPPRRVYNHIKPYYSINQYCKMLYCVQSKDNEIYQINEDLLNP